VQVPGSRPPRTPPGSDSGSRMRRNIHKNTVALVPIQQAFLAIGHAQFPRIDFGIHMTVCHEEILPTIVVEIEKAGSPTEEARVHSQSRPKGRVSERTVAAVVVER